MARLNTDRSLAPLVAQFVPLKIDTGTPDWPKWHRKYPIQSNAIPIIYVIRADGEMVYGQSGSLPGPQLPQMMLTMLRQSGKMLSVQQALSLEEAVSSAKQAFEQGDVSAAMEQLQPFKKLGELGELPSHAAPVQTANELTGQMIEKAKETLTQADAQLASEDAEKRLAGALAYQEVQRAFAGVSQLKAELAAISRKYKRDDAAQEALEQAEMIADARRIAASDPKSRRAVGMLQQVVERWPGTPAAEIAREEIASLGGEAPQPRSQRTWTDATGRFQMTAKLLAVEDGVAQLQRQDNGKTISVPVEKLSRADQEFVADWLK